MTLDAAPVSQQYCLKWNNHKKNISGVFERLRSDERFVDVTLASADQKMIRCHRVILCAGSGYLEDILSQNPSDHPTIVLSQIQFCELKHLVDFMYAGEVAVDQNSLTLLLDAAKVLKIKGLWESGLDTSRDDSEEEIPPQIEPQIDPPEEGQPDKQTSFISPAISPSMPGLKSPPPMGSLQAKPQVTHVVGSKRRKRSRNPGSLDDVIGPAKQIKTCKQSDESPNKLYSPLFGVSNAYFLTQPPPLKTIMEKAASATTTTSDLKPTILNSSPPTNFNENLMKDIPNLLSQTPVHPALISAMNNVAGSLPFLPQLPNSPSIFSMADMQSDTDDKSSVKGQSTSSTISLTSGSTPVRRYKQYTEDTLQSALKDIMEGQSINRSSMKYNIPARTLRDWMKRLNIKSVFTHHSQQKEGRGSGHDSNPDESLEQKINGFEKANGSALYPDMLTLGEAIRAQSKSVSKQTEQDDHHDGDDDEEEEIDDDEEEQLKVVVSGDES